MSNPRIGRKILEERQAMSEEIRVKEQESVSEITIEQAADVMMSYLPPDTQFRIREARESLQLPLWQHFLGLVMNTVDRQQIYAPHILSSWEGGEKPSNDRVCKECGSGFWSRFSQALYCCPPCFFKKGLHADDCPTKEYVPSGV